MALQQAFLVAAVLVALFASGHAIKKCYGTTPEPFKTKNAPIRNCTASDDVCVRAEYYVIGGKTYVQRYCAHSNHMVAKITADMDEIKVHSTAGIDLKLRSVSTCTKDFCNGAKATQLSWSLLVLAVAAVCVGARR